MIDTKADMKKKVITQDQAKDTGLAMMLILLLIGYFGDSLAILLPSIIVLVITMTRPILFTPLAKLWFEFSHLLGLVGNKVILTTVFLLVVIPIALIRRVAGADAMRSKEWGRSDDSAFIVREHTYTKEDLNNPY
jgi:hypothetical protein